MPLPMPVASYGARSRPKGNAAARRQYQQARRRGDGRLHKVHWGVVAGIAVIIILLILLLTLGGTAATRAAATTPRGTVRRALRPAWPRGPTTRSTAAAAPRSTAQTATIATTGAAPRIIVRARTRVGVNATRALRRSRPPPANASPWTERAWPRGPTRPSPDAPPLRTRARRTLSEMPATIRRHRRRRRRGAASTQNARARAAAGATASPDAPPGGNGVLDFFEVLRLVGGGRGT